jgi:hypothetical protein
VAEETFSTPVAFALDAASGKSVHIETVPDAVVPHGSPEYVSKEMERHLHDITAAGGEGEPIVGALPGTGQLFAMPLGDRTTKADESRKQHTHSLAALSSAQSSSTTAVAKPKPTIHSIATSAGRQHAQFYQHHHDASRKNSKGCGPGSAHFPGCLNVGSSDRRDPFSRGHPGGFNFLSKGESEEGDSALVPLYHPHYGYIPPEHFYAHIGQGPHFPHRSSQKNYQRMLRILGSWLPPTIALIFVVSFELGRRKRQKDSQLESVDSTSEIMSSTSNVMKKSEDGQGIIQVYEDVILGYGGHGTVVYKGSLEGRQVAVKRMLKTYLSSADREISLLIESDGHPNVVRYFLKEIRGDFVYLALELCDLSLHNLIGTVRTQFDQMEKENRAPTSISPSTKAILFGITSGVRHLHHLRIVHRDLKPAST